jgi:hypothetical protein
MSELIDNKEYEGRLEEITNKLNSMGLTLEYFGTPKRNCVFINIVSSIDNEVIKQKGVTLTTSQFFDFINPIRIILESKGDVETILNSLDIDNLNVLFGSNFNTISEFREGKGVLDLTGFIDSLIDISANDFSFKEIYYFDDRANKFAIKKLTVSSEIE